MELTKKVLEEKGASIGMMLKKKEDGSHEEIDATLFWKTEVDLDLYALYVPKGATFETAKKGFFGGKKAAKFSDEGTVNYSSKGYKDRFPFIRLDEDSGVGDKLDSDAGNEENMHITKIDEHQHILIVANIYGKKTNFAQYNGKVTVKVHDQQIEVPLNETKEGSWCVVAHIDNTGPELKLININRIFDDKPTVGEIVSAG